MRILIVGAGVLGSRYAAGLQLAGHHVTLLARARRYRELRDHGIVLEDAVSHVRRVTAVPLIEDLDPQATYDLALVIVRANQVADVLPALAANVRIPSVLFLGNNIAGPGAMVSALGRDRVLLGFAGAGGVREGHCIRYVAMDARRDGITFLGELDGRMSPRITEIAQAFEGSGFPAKIESRMEAWLAYHVALVTPIAYAIYMAGGDIHRLAHTRDALTLGIRGVHEGFAALRRRGVPVTPAALAALEWIPEPLLLAVIRKRIDSVAGELMMAGHANAARDEMWALAEGLRARVRDSGVPTPCLDRLLRYGDPQEAPVAAGHAEIPLRWSGVAVTAGVMAGGLIGVSMLARKWFGAENRA